ncbi:hypothetical protein ACLHDD_12855 [Pantoea sp. NSTU24]|uniref:hypothetical protein n=1 Tax=Pantoea sp. NSTU24 TaxID=3391144 RepID=UPI003CFDED28
MSHINNKTKITHLNPMLFDQVEGWLKDNRINYDLTRFGQAAKYYKSWLETKETPSFRELWSISELIDLFDFYNSFNSSGEVNSSFLRRISKGTVLIEEDIKKSARDLAFELKIASRFKRAGFTIIEDNSHDVVAEKKSIRFFIECKRPKNIGTLIKNMRFAFDKQLPRETINNSIICIDISNIIYNSQKIDFDNGKFVQPLITAEKLIEYRNHIDRKFKNFINKEAPDIAKEIRMIILYYSFPIFLDEDIVSETIRFMKLNHFVTMTSINDEINKEISKALNDSVGKQFNAGTLS